MSDAIGSDYGYRDYYNNYLRGSDTANETEKTQETHQYNAVFTDEKKAVSVDDFLTLMVAQLTNQDFMNPVDDTQYVTQLAQFATMQQMQELASYMKTGYVLSLIGQNVTAAKFTVAGDVKKETGPVEKVTLADNEYAVYVNGQKFKLEQIMEIHTGNSASDEIVNSSKASYLASLLGKSVSVRVENKDHVYEEISGVVSNISTKDGKYQLRIDDKWYDLSQVSQVNSD